MLFVAHGRTGLLSSVRPSHLSLGPTPVNCSWLFRNQRIELVGARDVTLPGACGGFQARSSLDRYSMKGIRRETGASCCVEYRDAIKDELAIADKA